jgi:hypothetical protein
MLNARMALARSLREGIYAPKTQLAGKLGMFAQSGPSGKCDDLAGAHHLF